MKEIENIYFFVRKPLIELLNKFHMEHIRSSPHQFQSGKGTIILEGKGSIPHSIKTVAKRCINNMLLVLTK